MELKTIFSNVEPSNKNVIWLTVINGIIIQKIYTANGWQIVGSPYGAVTTDSDYISPNSLYGAYVNNGGSKTKEEFNEALFNLIG